jgi:pimeloyl-ACP methyl ester carboxylesterase
MGYLKNGYVEVFSKDWGSSEAQAIAYHHSSPPGPADWNSQSLLFPSASCQSMAHDQRDHGQSSQVADCHNIDPYAAGAFALTKAYGLREAAHVSEACGGRDVARYVAATVSSPATWRRRARRNQIPACATDRQERNTHAWTARVNCRSRGLSRP